MCIMRPALGCIVEGEGERISFPSLIYRLCDTIVKPIQIAQADGNGDIIANLEDELTDIAEIHAPITIIVHRDCHKIANADKNMKANLTRFEVNVAQDVVKYLIDKRFKEFNGSNWVRYR